MTRISVAMAVYRGARYLPEQLGSILDAEVVPDEIVVSDDRSDDETVDIVRSFANARGAPVIRLVRNAGERGVVANFSTALRSATGDIVVLADQDDVWHPDRLVGVAERFDRDPTLTLIHSDADLIGPGGEGCGHTLFQAIGMDSAQILAEREDAFPVLLRRNTITGATAVFRRSLVERALPVPSPWMHDEWLGIVAAATGRVEVDTARRIDYRQHDENQIGARVPDLRYRIMRMTVRDPERNRNLADRAAVLVRRLEELSASSSVVDAARAKWRFERDRAALPRARPLRVGGVARLALSPGYPRFASQGRLDIVRDLVQPR